MAEKLKPDLVKVTQADRIFAAPFVVKASGVVTWKDERFEQCLKGYDDDSEIVQSVARYRLSVLEEAAKVAAKACYNPPSDKFHEGWNDASRSIATAIRSLSQPEGSAGASEVSHD